MNLGPNEKKTLLTDAASLAVGLTVTFLLGWSTRDLIWSLWISSLISGILFHLRGSVRAKGLNGAELALGSIPVLFGLGFFLIHFGFFHYIQGSILDLLIPLEPDPGRVYIGRLTWTHVRDFSFFHSIGYAVRQYWPFVLTALLHQFANPRPNLKTRTDSFKPYVFVLKLHLLMFPLAAFYELGLESFPVYALVLFVFFTPGSLRLLLGKKNGMVETEGTVGGR